jgi:hypothetical protein
MKKTKANPYLDGLKAKAEAEQAVSILQRQLGKMVKVGRKQIYLVTNKKGEPFYVWIVSAPSNLKFDSAIKGIIKEHGKYPLYVLFTRDVKTYPAMGASYWDKIKAVYKKANRNFKGAIMGLNEFNTDIAQQMIATNKIQLDFRRYIDLTDGNVTIQQVLKELAGLSPAKLKAVLPVLQMLK